MVLGKNIERLLMPLCFVMAVMSCQKEGFNEVSFIGDSIVARWDIKKFFPSTVCENKGLSGSGLDYIQSNSGCMKGKTAVVLFGTNDIEQFSEAYTEAYIQAIRNLLASRTVVISILSRARKGDDENINGFIALFNDDVKRKCASNGWQYVDAYDVMQNGGNIVWKYFSDGLHLSEQGYEVLSDELRRIL